MFKEINTTVETIDREKLLKEAKKDLENYMKVNKKIRKIEPNAAIRLRTYFESMVNTQVRALERKQADEAKAAELEALKALQETPKKETTGERLERLEKALKTLGVEV